MVGDNALPKVLIIGDSIAFGYFEPLKELMAGVAELTLIPENGGSTHLGLEKPDEWVGNGKWDIIHFNWGLHDLRYMKDGEIDVTGERASTLDVYKANLLSLVDRLSKTGARLIWASITPIPEGANGRIPGEELEFNLNAEIVMRERGIAVDDLHYAVTPLLSELQLPADVHFLEQGSRFLAARVAEAIRQAIDAQAT